MSLRGVRKSPGATTSVSMPKNWEAAAHWTVEQAADFLWALLSIDTWERLTTDCGWSKEQYIERLQLAAAHALTRRL